MPGRRTWKGALLLAGALALVAAGLWLVRAPMERALHARLVREAGRLGLTLRVERVRAGLAPLVRLEGVRVDKGSWSLGTDAVAFTLRGRVSVAPARLTGPAELAVAVVPTTWAVTGRRSIALRAPAEGLSVRWAGDQGRRHVDVRAQGVPLAEIVTISRSGVPLLDPGVLDGGATLTSASGALRFAGDVRGGGLRLASLEDTDGEEATFGPPADVRVGLEGTWARERRTVEVRSWRVSTPAAAAGGSLRVSGVGADAEVDLLVEVERVDFARLLHLSALEAPLGADGGPVPAGALGSAALTATARGRLADAASFRVTQKLAFDPPTRPLPALERLRGPFVHEVATAEGSQRIDVSPGSPDFVALEDVPPLFVETLLLGEDYGFYGHPGVDLSELPSALITNWRRGGAARGASTITQQLAKNLFLTREKKVGRKLQELSLALLLESTLDKRRILEIYLNVIEWGPGLYGLRPASRRYFGVEPRELGIRQMAFLVALVPGPRKYQRSFATGTLSPGFRPLVDNLLAKLRSVDALTEEEYREALAEELYVRPGDGGAAVTAR